MYLKLVHWLGISAMEFLLFLSPVTAMAFIFAFLLFLYSFGSKNSNNKKRVAPEAAGGWPLLGHLPLLGGPKLPHEVLGAMADKYGPIFTIRLGFHRALVVSSSEIARECFTTNDRIFSTRPKSIANEHFGYNYAMFGLSPYGPYWRELRKITVVELLSNHRLAMLNHVRESEVKRLIKELQNKLLVKNRSSSDKLLVDMKKWFGDMTFNLILRIIAGKQYSDDCEERQVAMRKSFELMGVFTVGDAIPWLRWLDLGGYEKAMKKTAKELDGMLQEWLEEHKQRRRVNSDVHKSEQDFMDVLLSILDDATRDEDHYNFDVDTINKATCLVSLHQSKITKERNPFYHLVIV